MTHARIFAISVLLAEFGDEMRSSPQENRPGADCPVVIVGGSMAGLGAARSLAPAHASVVVLDTSRFNAGMASRHCSGRVIAAVSGRKLVDELKAVARDFAQQPLL